VAIATAPATPSERPDLDPVVLSIEAKLLVLVAMAGVQRIAHPLQHLVVELQKSQKFGELLFQQ
jgi:hypothetical protein